MTKSCHANQEPEAFDHAIIARLLRQVHGLLQLQ